MSTKFWHADLLVRMSYARFFVLLHLLNISFPVLNDGSARLELHFSNVQNTNYNLHDVRVTLSFSRHADVTFDKDI